MCSGNLLTHVQRRVAYIVFYVIAPYALSRLYGLLRTFVVRKGEALAQLEQRQLVLRHVRQERGEPVPPMERDTYYRAAIRWLAANLPGSHVLSASDGWVAYAYAAQLALFYLGGRYYTIAHRLADVDYVHAVAKRPNMRPQSYEILGMLLVFQLLVKFGLSARSWLRQRAGEQQTMDESKAVESSEKQEGQMVRIDDAVYSHAESPAAKLPSKEPPAAVPLAYADPDTTATPEQLGIPTPSGAAEAESLEIAQAASRARGSQLEAIAEDVLRCTLCMDRRTPERGNSALTECGHVFCWDCITSWAREKVGQGSGARAGGLTCSLNVPCAGSRCRYIGSSRCTTSS